MDIPFAIGVRVNAEDYGPGRVFAISKPYAIAYIRWDHPYNKHGARELAVDLDWAESLERISARA